MSFTTKSKLGWPIVIFLSLLPAVFWFTAYPLHFRFLGPTPSRTFSQSVNSIGQLLGLIGMGMFALNFVLSTRLKWLEDFFGGMNKVYTAHHIMGGLSFVFLLFHPLFLASKYIPVAGAESAKLFLLSTDIAINFGIIALGLLQIFLILTFFIKLPYQMWKLTHKFLGLAFFFASLHVLSISSDVATLQYLRYYMILLVLLGGAAILYRTILGFALIPREKFIVKEVKSVTPSIWEITLKHASGKNYLFTPGQFIFIGFPGSDGLEEVHPFSISSQTDGDHVKIGVKALGDFTKKFSDLKPGMQAEIEGPFGRTSYTYYANKKQVWIAGGIGITPFLGMARSLKHEDGYIVDLYYSLIDRSDTPFVSELEELSHNNPNFRFIPWYSKESGFLSADSIIKQSEGVAEKEIFICGPPPMMKSIKSQFKKLSVPTRNVHSEEFALN